MPNNETMYKDVIKYLDDDSTCQLPPVLASSVCPRDANAVVDKFLDAGVKADTLTAAFAKVFKREIYDESKYGPPLKKCDIGQWLVSADGTIFFVANPFLNLSPGQVLSSPTASKVKRIGILPVSKQKGTLTNRDSSVESEQLINRWLCEAYKQKATDIHINPLNGNSVRILFRVDGQLITYEDKHLSVLEDSLYQHISNTLMRMCHLEAGVYSAPQDGKFRYNIADMHSIGVRLAMRPVNVYGIRTQGFWLRILDTQSSFSFPSIDDLGLALGAKDLLNKLRKTNQNLILLTGPTGSGKSTTLYSTLLSIQRDSPERSIQTLEDPVEVHIDGIAQTQVNPKSGMSFAEGVRSLMRCDVDVILIGEIRDEETARLAVRAALTGHLVLATIHCKTALEAVGRLVDLGITPKMITNVLAASFAQRLVRRVCQKCKHSGLYEKFKPQIKYSFLEQFFKPGDRVTMDAGGCAECNRKGYSGRCVVSEALPMTRQLGYQIIQQDQEGMDCSAEHVITLWEHAASLIKSGVTTVEECLQVLPVQDLQDKTKLLKFRKRFTTLNLIKGDET